MDPVNLVVMAFVVGLTSGVAETTKTAVMDVYQIFKSRLTEKVELIPVAKEALASLELKPESEGRQEVLKEELSTLSIGKDTELVHLAQKFLELFDEQGAKAGKYNISIKDSQGIVIGDQTNVTQRFTNRK